MSKQELDRWLEGLLPQARQGSITRVVLGNEAADLDSMASAVAFARLLAGVAGPGERPAIPVISIPREDYALRTEAVWLFREAGLEATRLVFLDDIDLDRLHEGGRLGLVLVDHNRLPKAREAWGPAVEEILDHHQDEGQHTQARRNVAPVGSTATLVAERFLQQAPELLEGALATLLLGTILLDTVDLDPAAKRVTPRDEQAAAGLLPISAADRKSLFDRLQTEKFNVSSLSTRDILRKDYKEYTMGAVRCGISSALLSLGDWVGKDRDLEASFGQYARSRGLHMLLAMCAYTQPEVRRELAVYCPDAALRDGVAAFLNRSGLGLSPLAAQAGSGALALYAQADAGGSRKKLQPLLAGFLQNAKPAG